MIRSMIAWPFFGCMLTCVFSFCCQPVPWHSAMVIILGESPASNDSSCFFGQIPTNASLKILPIQLCFISNFMLSYPSDFLVWKLEVLATLAAPSASLMDCRMTSCCEGPQKNHWVLLCLVLSDVVLKKTMLLRWFRQKSSNAQLFELSCHGALSSKHFDHPDSGAARPRGMGRPKISCLIDTTTDEHSDSASCFKGIFTDLNFKTRQSHFVRRFG